MATPAMAPLPATPEAVVKLDLINRELDAFWSPPADIKVSEWAERNIFLRKGTTSRPGKFVVESYQREIMDAMCDPLVARIVFRKSVQVGWSQILNIICGYFIDCQPKPMMMVQPTHQNAKDYSKKRLAPLMEDCPAVRDKLKKNVSRRGGNTTLLKEFAGGFLKITGANSGAQLRSDPVPIVLGDEVEVFGEDVNGEGDAIKIIERRTDQWPEDEVKIFLGSTPARPKGLSRIDDEYKAGSQALFHVPCPLCGFMQPLWWRDPETKVYRLKYSIDERDDVIRKSVYYLCAKCEGFIQDKHKEAMLRAGRWIHKYPERTTKSYHINALYSPWKANWHTLASDWHKAQGDREKLKAFINLQLGETFEEGGEQLDKNALLKRREEYPRKLIKSADGKEIDGGQLVPNAVCVLVNTVDVQHNRVELQTTGFGAGEDSYLIEHEPIMGDPSGGPDVWRELEEWLLQSYEREDGRELMPAITLIDSGSGGHIDAVYKFTEPRQNTSRRVYAAKGFDFLSKPGLAIRSTSKKQKIIVWNVATYACKDRIFSRLANAKVGQGAMHFPMWTQEEYFDQLIAERKIPVTDKKTRRARMMYVQTHPRNEALDLTVYAHAGLYILQNYVDPATYRDLDALAQSLAEGRRLVKPRTRRIRSRGVI